MKSISYNWQEIGLARALRKLGHQCDVVFYGKEEGVVEIPVEEKSCSDQIKLFFIKGLPLYDATLFFGLKKLAATYDIIQVAEYDQLESWHLAGMFPNKTVVYHGPYHSDLNFRYNLKCKGVDSLLLRRYVRCRTPFIAKSEMSADFLKHKGIENVTTIGVGLDVAQLDGSKRYEAGRLVANIASLRTSGLKNMLYVGRIEPRRNPYLLLQVLSALLQAGKKVHLTVVGRGDKRYVRSWLKASKDFGVAEHLNYIPGLPQGELPNLYRNSDVFLLPTSYEIFGMVLLESMYFGVPVITTVNGGSTTMIRNWVNGITINSLDPTEWKGVVSTILSDKITMARIGSAASRTIRESFTWDALAPRFVEVYQRFLS